MALVADGFELNVTLLDSGLNTANLRYVLDAADHATALTDSGTILAALAAITQAEIKAYNVSTRFIEDNLAVPVANVHVENRAVVVVQLDGNPLKKATVTVPAPSPDIFLATTGEGSNIVDVLDADLATYIDIWQVTPGVATLSDGEKVADGTAAVIRGKRTHRKSSSG